jgi:CHU_C Type IX secretion signal domain
MKYILILFFIGLGWGGSAQGNALKISPQDTTICQGQSVSLKLATLPGVNNINWTPAAGLNCTSCPNPRATPDATRQYIVSAQYQGQTVRDTVLITVRSLFGKTADTVICKGSEVKLSISSTFSGSFAWLDEQNGQNFFGQAVIVKPVVTTTYLLTYTGDQGRCVLQDRVKVTVSGEKIPIGFPFKTKVCPGEEVLLNALDGPADANYSWTSTPLGFVSKAPKPVVKPTVSTTYRVTATVGNCMTMDTVRIVIDNARLTGVSNDTTVCEGEKVKLKANGGVTGIYLWSFDGTTINNESPEVRVDRTTVYNLRFLYGDQNSCALTTSVKVTTIPGITDLNITSNLPVNSSPLEINAYASNDYSLTAVVTTMIANKDLIFKWTDEKGQTVGADVSINGKSDSVGTKAYKVLVTSAKGGCSKMLTIVVNILADSLDLPNAFSPDGVAPNDSFGLAIFDHIDRDLKKAPNPNPKIEILEVYNRWGVLVFQTTEPDPAKARWDGKINGVEAPPDVYVYRIVYRHSDGSLRIRPGEVTLLR